MPLSEELLQPNCLIREFRPDLREFFLNMNPSHFSCPYKPVFAQHAVENLIEYDESLSSLQPTPIPTSAVNQLSETSQSDDSDDPPTTQSCCQMPPHCSAKKHRDAASFPPDTFFQRIRIEKPTEQQMTNDVSPWQTDEIYGYDELSRLYLEDLQREPKKPVEPKHRISAYQSALDAVAAAKARAQQRENFAAWRQARSAEGIRAKSASNRVGGKTPDAVETKPIMVPTGMEKPLMGHRRKQIKYTFKHNMNTAEYIKNYREMYTRTMFQLAQALSDTTALQDQALSAYDTTPYIAKATVQCRDVRDGACIQPVKLSQFSFDIAKGTTLRTKAKATKYSGKNSPNASPVCTRRMLSQIMRSERPHAQKVLKARTPVNGKFSPSSTTVCRSRPSIPSNARGIICATAIETPSHLVPGRTRPELGPFIKGHPMHDRHMKITPEMRPNFNPTV